MTPMMHSGGSGLEMQNGKIEGLSPKKIGSSYLVTARYVK